MKRNTIFIIFPVLLISICHLPQEITFAQQFSFGQEFQINTGEIFNSTTAPVASGLPTDGFIVFWDHVFYNSQDRIFGQIFDGTGAKSGEEFQIGTFDNGEQSSPAITILGNSHFLVCWQSSKQDGDGSGIFGQIFDMNGGKIGNEFQVNTNTVGHQFGPVAARLNKDLFIVFWLSIISNSSRTMVYGQKLDVNGKKMGAEFAVSTSSVDGSFFPVITTTSLGRIILCWQAYSIGNNGRDILGQLFDSTGATINNAFKVNTRTGLDLRNLSVSNLEGGGFVVCWESYDFSNPDIFCQLFDDNGSKLGNEIRVSKDKSSFSPSVAPLSQNRSVIIYNKIRTQIPPNYDIHACLFDSSGKKVGTEFPIIESSIANETQPYCTSIAKNNAYIICWLDWSGSIYSIKGKILPSTPPIHLLQPFSLVAPRNDETLMTRKPDLSWQQPGNIQELYPWEITFDLFISEDFEFSNQMIVRDIIDTTFTLEKDLSPSKAYLWKILAKNVAGDSIWSEQQDWGFAIHPLATSIELSQNEIIADFQLFPNYPNPFNPATTFRISIPQTATIELAIYNMLGQRVRIVESGLLNAGTYDILWDATDDFGSHLASGVYFYRLEVRALDGTPIFTELRKMVLMR